MNSIFTHIINKSKQYTHRIFYACTNNSRFLHYETLFGALYLLDAFITTKIKKEEPSIILISNNILFKIIVFTYSFITASKLLMISPKFAISEIANTILSKRGVNLLFVDREIILELQILERQEGIDILSFFDYIETPLRMLELLLEYEKVDTTLNSITRKGRIHHLLNNIPSVGILSPGTTTESSIVNLPYKLLGQSMVDTSYFMGLKPGDKVSVIADFEFYPGVYTILGLLNGIQFILPETDNNLTGAEISEMLHSSNHKPNIVFISSNNFKQVWDNVILKVYSKKFMLTLAKYWLTKWIVELTIRRGLYSSFGKNVKKIHILNEELGFSVLETLAKVPSKKFMTSSSYGFLEQGNFLAFKDPEVFKHRRFILKPGGTILKDTELSLTIDNEHGFTSSTKLSVGEIGIIDAVTEHIVRSIRSGDIGLLMPNLPNQGDRKFLYVYGRDSRHNEVKDVPSLDLIEKSIKDSWLIRDCFLQRSFENGKYTHKLYVEIREELVDSKLIRWKEIEDTIKVLAKELDTHSDVKISHYAILHFRGMRNIVGKLQYYAM